MYLSRWRANGKELEQPVSNTNSTKTIDNVVDEYSVNSEGASQCSNTAVFITTKQPDANEANNLCNDTVDNSDFTNMPIGTDTGKTFECATNVGTKLIAGSSSSSRDNTVYLFTEKAAIPLKKRKIDVDKLAELISFPKEIQTKLTQKDIDVIFKYYKEAVKERNEFLLKISSLVIDVAFFEGNSRRINLTTLDGNNT